MKQSRGDAMRATWICNVEIFFFLSVSVCTLNAATCYIHSIPVATAEQSLRLVFALGVSVQTHVLPLHQVLHLPVRRDASRQDPHRLPAPPGPGPGAGPGPPAGPAAPAGARPSAEYKAPSGRSWHRCSPRPTEQHSMSAAPLKRAPGIHGGLWQTWALCFSQQLV